MPSIDFPADIPEPGTMFSAEVAEWYSSATKRIVEFMDVREADLSSLTSAWSAKSRLRYAAAMAMIDQDAAAEFMRDNALPGVDALLELARTKATSEPIAEALQLLLHPPAKPVGESIRAYNENIAYADVVMPNGQGEMCVKTGEGWKTVRSVLPPRPIVPNPEYIQTIEPFFATASVWQQAPRIGSPESSSQAPCTVSHGDSLWVGYLTDQDERIAVVRFSGYVEHQVSRIGTLLEGHPYFNAGLTSRAFNELSQSLYTKYWNRFSARHWVVNFPDQTMDIVAQSAELVQLPIGCLGTFGSVKAAIESTEE